MEKTNNLLFAFTFAFLVLLSVGFGSAALNVSGFSAPTLVNNSQGYFNLTFTLNNSDANSVNVSFVGSSIAGIGSVFADLTNVTIENNTASIFTKRVNFDSTKTGSIAGVLSINGNTNIFTTSIQQTPSSSSNNINSSKLCSAGIKNANLSISDLEDRSNVDDEWNWKALNNIQIRLNVENTNGKDNSDYKVQLYFFDDAGKDVSSKFVDDTDSLKQDINNLDNQEDVDVDFAFKLSTDVDSGSYTIVARITGDKSQCDVLEGDFQQISIDQDDDYAIVTNAVSAVTVGCGDTVDLTATVANTGSNDQDRVKVILYNRDLGLNLFKEIDNLDSGDTAEVTFSFAISQSAQEKLQRLELSTEYNYDDNDESYDDQSDTEDDYTYSLNILGGSCVDTTKPTLTAKLDSEAKVGTALVIQLSIKNNANTSISAIITPENYDSWATLSAINSTFSIDKQATKSAYITFMPTKVGQQTFNVNMVYNGKTLSQPVIVTIAAKDASFFQKAIENYGATTVWLITAIVALVIVILLIMITKLIVSAIRR